MSLSIGYYVFSALDYICPGGRLRLSRYVYPDRGAHVDRGIYVGSLATAVDPEVLAELGIEEIINLSGEHYETSLPMHHILIDDVPITAENIEYLMSQFHLGLRLIEIAVAKGRRILVHCRAGVNRSPTLIALYLISDGMPYVEAMDRVRIANMRRGTAILTNESYASLLRTIGLYRRYDRTKYITGT